MVSGRLTYAGGLVCVASRGVTADGCGAFCRSGVTEMSDIPEGAGWSPADVTGIIANPFYAIEIDPHLAAPHEPILGEDQWVQANARLIEELGPIAYLRSLLVILKGGYVTGGDRSEGSDGSDDGQAVYAVDDDDDHAHDHEHASIDADTVDTHVLNKVLTRLDTEPGFLARSIATLEDTGVEEDLADELDELESDPVILRDLLRASRATFASGELEPETCRLLILYTIDSVMIDPADGAIDQRTKIHWRTGDSPG